MNKRCKIFIIIFFSLASLIAQDVPVEVTKVATSAANWLKIETGTRAIGMGGSQVASGRGVTAVPYNPACLAYLDQSETFFSKSYFIAGISHNTLAYGTRLGSTDYFGLHLFFLDSGPIGETTEMEPDGTGRDYHVYDLALRLTYSKILTDRLRIGGTVKYIREQIYNTYMQTFALDIGSNFDTGIYGFILGMSISNFGPDVQFHGEGLNTAADDLSPSGTLNKVTQKFALPLMIRLGIQNDILGSKSAFLKSDLHRLTFSIDGINSIDYSVFGAAGLEYSWSEIAFLRLGTHMGHDTAGISSGFGVAYGGFSVDFAYVNYGILDETLQFGITLEF